MRDDRDDTQSFEVVERPPPPPATPPPPRPPRVLVDDVWPWLLFLGLLLVAGVLVWLFVLRSGNDTGTAVPAVVGMQQQPAFKLLQEKGYSVNAIVEPADEPRGIVVSQAPGAGTDLPKASIVTLHISNGRPLAVTTATTPTTTQAATTTTQSTLQVPEVTGQDMVSASGQIEAAGFVPETQPVDSQDEPGQVAAEDPAPGTQAAAGSTVVLDVAAGGQQPLKQVPNVLGQKAPAARQALLQAGLTVKTESKKAAAKYFGVVIAQRAAGGETQPAYTQVVITVGSY